MFGLRRNIVLLLTGAALLLLISACSQSETDKPGKGRALNPARATWNTGFFQEAIVRKGLIELGYKVNKPKDLTNPIFYKSVALGDIDYWTNGWFPMHNSQLPKNFDEKASTYGYIIKAGGLQGYLVSKKEADKYNIKSLDDFKRPEVKKAFDKNNDNKADLTACPPGWACENVITHHMKVYGLGKHINPVKASYEAGMAAALGAYKSGEPIFFYTWTPNWTVFKLKPGKDVMWINVPKIIPKESQKLDVEKMTQKDIKGAVTNPIKLGYVASDIRIVANKKFANENPSIKRFFELFTIPLSDINEQNTKMISGEKSQKHIDRHADEWIEKNRTTWDRWMKNAKSVAK